MAITGNFLALRHPLGRALLCSVRFGLGAVVLLSGCATHVDHGKSMARSEATSRFSVRQGAAYNRAYRVKGRVYRPLASAKGYRERGIASWYGEESGRRTAMGTRFDPHGLSAAHRTLPLPTRVRVTNLGNRRSIILVVNDRGPFIDGRLIDLSRGAAKALRLNGLGRVEVEALD
ncbi:septal ring lytic transglycosylase RlpA family protein [Methylococcus capsulatus]|nr:septal ring lytic transglycosylase RlpA family protein [Methylococcus capsulatus]QXP86623.1 septal ring lytic transglycosylase RlpA family protein [Methylococcus capsulatus]QXP95025.1 septal ring lytic transglycosylase RlpA family protein [Methylococcus capsulatus]UQN11586.1 septal ring lytic transglycosylase RlpA family protein [Methylococcus capsulatus]